MTQILDGRMVQEKIKERLRRLAHTLHLKPRLVIIQIGRRPESNLYIAKKKDFGAQIGVEVIHRQYPETVTEAELLASIKLFNNDTNVHGIIVQLPLPDKLLAAQILNTVNPLKDVDGLTVNGFQSATARGVLNLLDYYHISLDGQEVVVIGRSAPVGKPIALACLDAGATVTICHRQTKNLSEITKRADILIAAAGAPGLITGKHVCNKQVVVDVGINVLPGPERKIVGDVLFGEVAPRVRAISPVPGGIGPLTVAGLFENLFEACERQA